MEVKTFQEQHIPYPILITKSNIDPKNGRRAFSILLHVLNQFSFINYPLYIFSWVAVDFCIKWISINKTQKGIDSITSLIDPRRIIQHCSVSYMNHCIADKRNLPLSWEPLVRSDRFQTSTHYKLQADPTLHYSLGETLCASISCKKKSKDRI